jgi:hypothetical protein
VRIGLAASENLRKPISPDQGPMSELGLGRVKTPTLNLRVEISSRFRKFENQKCLQPLLREDNGENNSAYSSLVHVFTQPGSKAEKLETSICLQLCRQERTSPLRPANCITPRAASISLLDDRKQGRNGATLRVRLSPTLREKSELNTSYTASRVTGEAKNNPLTIQPDFLQKI